jgi:non-specific serine/threonine protein kinase
VAAVDVLAVLDALLQRSLVYVFRSQGTPRYGLLETVRQYGVQQLERAGERDAVRERHLRWCVSLARQAAPALQGPEQAAWLARLEREHDNVRAALRWVLDRGMSARGLELVAGLWPFWRSHRRHLSEGRHWLASVLALPADKDDPTVMALRALALEGAAWLAEDEHDFAQAAALFAESSAARHALGQDERTTRLLINEAMEARARGDYARATRLLEESLASYRTQGNRESITRGGLGLALSRLALVLAEQGEYTRATALYEECVALHRELGDREGRAYALLGLGDIARDQGDTDRVYTYCEESLAIFRELGHPLVGFALNNLALAAYLDGDLALAARRAEEGASFFRQLQAEPNLAEVLVTRGRIQGAQGETAAAQASLAEALRLAWVKGPRWIVAAALEALGAQAVRRAQVEHGVHLLAAAATLRRAMGTPVWPADRSAREDVLAAARGSLGDVAFDKARAVGETLPLQQIVASDGA